MTAHGHEHDNVGGNQRGNAGRSHAPALFGRAFAIGTGLDLTFVVVEVIYGLSAGSVALLADAGHNMGDVLGLLMAWGAATVAKRRPSGRYTCAPRSSSILAAFRNALLLLVATGIIAFEAIRRLSDNASATGKTVMIVAAVGILVNGITALLFLRGRKGDLNVKAAFLHMAADAGLAAGVVVAPLIAKRVAPDMAGPVVDCSLRA